VTTEFERTVVEPMRLGDREVTVVDLSRPLANGAAGAEPNPHRIEYVDHRESVRRIGPVLGSVGLWREDLGGASETVELTTHSGTHVDAPYHYGPESGGEPARTIDAVPLSWCMGPGVLLDFSAREVGEGITDADVARELERIGHRLAPGEIVLIRTDAWQRFGEPGYSNLQPGLRRSATAMLVEAGVRMIGIDAWGLDRPFDVMVAEAREGDRDQFWESHYYGTEREYLQIEQLCNLDKIPAPTGFTVLALPVLIAGASAAWSRTVALLDEGEAAA
jgi:kynurenine formamidase